MTKIQKRITLDSPLELQPKDKIVKVGFDREAPHPLEVDCAPYEPEDSPGLVRLGIKGLDLVLLYSNRSVTVLREVDEPSYKVGTVAKIGSSVFVRGAEKWAMVGADGTLSMHGASDFSVASDERQGLVTFITGGAG